jgi:hypothetical protein
MLIGFRFVGYSKYGCESKGEANGYKWHTVYPSNEAFQAAIATQQRVIESPNQGNLAAIYAIKVATGVLVDAAKRIAWRQRFGVNFETHTSVISSASCPIACDYFLLYLTKEEAQSLQADREFAALIPLPPVLKMSPELVYCFFCKFQA